MTRTDCFRFALLASTALSAVPALAGDKLPTGASVAHGSVDVSTPAANAMAIRQSSDTAIVNWRGFSIGEGARVDIRQPSTSSAMLNRVTGSTPSSIAGQLNANGQVYLINPNGIAITPTGTVRTGAFVASTLATTDEDFIAGRRSFQGKGRSAAVVNQGSIEVGPGGYAALIGGKVDNSGQITARLGSIGLGAGEQATLDLSGDAFLQVAVPSDGDDDGALITHSGRLSADGGRVEIKAATARQMARQVINLSGVVEARSVSGRSGAIVLGGGSGGRVRVSGRLDASAARPEPLAAITPPPPRPERGGSITVTGDAIELAGATLDASGPAGGGTVRIGGDYQGGGTLPHAATTSIDATSTIAADALASGDGGSVVVWSDEHTAFDGRISARGGPLGGNGGSAEVSGKAKLGFTGIADLSAPKGAFGTLLLDPGNIVISNDTTTGECVDADEDEGVTALVAIPVDNAEFEPAQANSILNAGDLIEQLGLSNVFVVTSDAFDGDGNITVAAPLSWASTSTLSLQAFGDILINNSITAPNGGLTLTTGFGNEGGGQQITTNALGAISVGTFILDGGDWLQNASPLPAFFAADFRILDGSFLRVLGGNGEPGTPYRIADIYGLQGIGSSTDTDTDPDLPDLADSYALAQNIDATVTAGWNDVEGPEGFNPIEGGEAGPFVGSFQGNGFAINGLFIDRGFEDTGVFGSVGFGGAIDNVALTNANISGGGLVGGLAGQNEGVISRARVIGGTVTGFTPDQGVETNIGGVVGQNLGSVTQSFSTANIVGNGLVGTTMQVGGLVGQNGEDELVSGTVSDSFAAGAVTGTGAGAVAIGGLVGSNLGEGSIIRAYATGAVAANNAGGGTAGGLAGENLGAINQTYATGAVSAANDATTLGGLVGGPLDDVAPAPVANSFWDSTTTLQTTSAGGGAPLATAAFQNTLAFMAQAEDAGWSFTTTWAPPDPGHYPELYSVSPVIWSDIGDASATYGFPASFRPPVTQSGGPGRFAFDTATVPPLVPLVSPGLPSGDVGTYTVTGAPTVTSTGGITYRVVSTPGTLTVTPAPLTITADDQTKLYGRTFGFAGTEFTARGLANDDAVTSVDLASRGASRGAQVGEGAFRITASDAEGEGLANYTISYVEGLLRVTPAPLVVTADDQDKRFGQEFAFNGTEFRARGLVNGDAVTSALLRSDGAPATALPSSQPYAIDISDAQGRGLSFGGVLNYDITYVPGELLVVPPPQQIPPDPSRLPTFDAGLRLVYYDYLPNPPDEVEIAGTEAFGTGGGSGGPTLGPTRPGGTTLARETAQDTLSFVEALSSRLETRVSACNPVPPNTDIFLACVRDALADYASELDSRILDLPPPLRSVSAVIRQSASEIEGVRADAARRIALATSDAEVEAIQREAALRAGAAVQTAVVEIRRAIELIRAEDDPQLASLQSRQGAAITAALQNVEDELSQAVGL